MTNGLERLTYGKPAKIDIKDKFLQALKGIEEPTGVIGRPYETPEFKQKPLYEVPKPKEPKTTVSREYVAGQFSEEEWQRSQEITQMKTEYKKALSQIYTKKEDLHRIGGMELPELEEAWNNYQEWEVKRQQQQITEFGKQLGLDVSMVEQIQSVYPEEELTSRLQTAGMYMTLLKSKHTSATLLKQFQDFMFPEVEAEEEPTMGERMEDIEAYRGLTTGEEGQPVEELPFDIASEYDTQVQRMSQDIVEAYQELGEYPPDLLDAIITDFAESYGITMTPEEAKARIDWTLQGILGVSVDWGGQGETTPTPDVEKAPSDIFSIIKGKIGL